MSPCDTFITKYQFPIRFSEYKSITQSFPSGLFHLMKGHQVEPNPAINLELFINGINLLGKKCTNRIIRKSILNTKRTKPKCKLQFYYIDWKKTWFLPFNYCINNKIRENNFKMLHRFYPTNEIISKFTDISSICSFCAAPNENIIHLFLNCSYSTNMWKDTETYLSHKLKNPITLTWKQVITFLNHDNLNISKIVNAFILLGKYHIHKAKFSNSKPLFKILLAEFNNYMDSLKHLSNKKAVEFCDIFNEIMVS